jgi:hypothetical protein
MGNLVNRDYEPTLAQAGDTVNIPIPPTLVANNLAAGNSVQLQNPTLGNAQIVLSTHAEATFQVPDVIKVLAVPDLLKLYMQPAMIALAEKIETDLLNLTTSFTANTAVGTLGTPISEETVDAAETALFTSMVPASEPKHLIVSPSTYSQLRQIPRFSEYQMTDQVPTAIVNGTVGKLKDFTVYRSQFVPSTSSGTNNLAFARSALGLVVRRLPQPLPGTGAIAEYAELGNFGMRVILSYQPNTLAQQFTVDVLYGVGVLQNVFGVQVYS